MRLSHSCRAALVSCPSTGSGFVCGLPNVSAHAMCRRLFRSYLCMSEVPVQRSRLPACLLGRMLSNNPCPRRQAWTSSQATARFRVTGMRLVVGPVRDWKLELRLVRRWAWTPCLAH
nr:hypothetical protein CFP56_36409 [Quercus suber]